MAYTDDAVKAKLSALNETSESIVTVSQWVMFHRRHADRTAAIWVQRLKESSANKRLNLIYLANEVVQQSKVRKKEDFLVAFSPIIADASAIAYKGATNELQNKLRRVIEVWRQRLIFEAPIQEAVEARIDELDKNRSSSKKPLLGGSLFSSASGPSAPAEIQPLVPLQIALSKASATTASAVPTADTEYDKLTDPTKNVPTPPVYAARLSALLKNLATAEGAVVDSIKARRGLLEGLEKIVQANRTSLAKEEEQHTLLSNRKNAIEARKREVEDGIMRGLSAESSPITHGSPLSDPRANGRASTTPLAVPSDPDRPAVEALTPPTLPQEPPNDPPPFPNNGAPGIGPPHHPNNPTPSPGPPFPLAAPPQQAGSDLLSSLSMPPVRHYASPGGGLSKKRKLDDEAVAVLGGGDAMEGLDEDVAELLRQESGGL